MVRGAGDRTGRPYGWRWTAGEEESTAEITEFHGGGRGYTDYNAGSAHGRSGSVAMKDAECKFCAVAREELAAAIVYEDDQTVAFLDRRPLFPGHCLLVPRDHIETLDDLPRERVGPFFETVQRLTRAVERAMKAEGTFVALNNRVSQSVAHLHVHVVPRRKGDGLRGFFWPRTKYPDAATERKVAAAIRAAIAQRAGGA